MTTTVVDKRTPAERVKEVVDLFGHLAPGTDRILAVANLGVQIGTGTATLLLCSDLLHLIQCEEQLRHLTEALASAGFERPPF